MSLSDIYDLSIDEVARQNRLAAESDHIPDVGKMVWRRIDGEMDDAVVEIREREMV